MKRFLVWMRWCLVTFGTALQAPAGRERSAFELPAGFELLIVATPPLVTHPLMGCFDNEGRLYVGDAAGLNLDEKALAAQLPNRIVRLEDVDGDGTYDRSTLFADKMTFPQGSCWLDDSLYVASPPGIWKLTDTNDDGIADLRQMIVGGFDYTGNAADVHGPFLHPYNGRLFWCHGRKGHNVKNQDGSLVHEGLAAGLWSCRPDGSDIQWEALGNMDNPVEVDFMEDGQVIGSTNLLFQQPRGDVLHHWLYGAVYDERPEWARAIVGLPRTIDHMPIVYNFGHAAVSGMLRYRSGQLNPAWRDHIFVVHFNTQKVVRMSLQPAGSTYRAQEHEFLKIYDPDVHLTDVIEDADGSLLVLDTGGWFRIGCPSSLTAKPDLRGAIYRIRKKNATRVRDPFGKEVDWKQTPLPQLAQDERWWVRERARRLAGATVKIDSSPAAISDSSSPRAQLLACEKIARGQTISSSQRAALLALLDSDLDPALEHMAMFAAIRTNTFDLKTIHGATTPQRLRRLLQAVSQTPLDPASTRELIASTIQQIDAADPTLASVAITLVSRYPHAFELLRESLSAQIASGKLSPGHSALLTKFLSTSLSEGGAKDLVTDLLLSPAPDLRRAAWQMIGLMPKVSSYPVWLPPLKQALKETTIHSPDLGSVIEAIAKVQSADFDGELQAIINHPHASSWVQLKAISALLRPGERLTAHHFSRLLETAQRSESPMNRVDAAKLLVRTRLSKDQMRAIVEIIPAVDATTLLTLLPLALRTEDPEMREQWARQTAQSPYVSSIQESTFRRNFLRLDPAIYEEVVGPVVRRASEEVDARKRKLEALSASAPGHIKEGRDVFKQSTCIACHRVGTDGGTVGPDLSRIGSNRSARDLLESIIFPHATITREFENYQIDLADGRSLQGLIRGDSTEGLLVVGADGQQQLLPHTSIVNRQPITSSAMPEGLDRAFTDQQLLDLVAWLGSLQ